MSIFREMIVFVPFLGVSHMCIFRDFALHSCLKLEPPFQAVGISDWTWTPNKHSYLLSQFKSSHDNSTITSAFVELCRLKFLLTPEEPGPPQPNHLKAVSGLRLLSYSRSILKLCCKEILFLVLWTEPAFSSINFEIPCTFFLLACR